MTIKNIFDGHGGVDCAQYLKKTLYKNIKNLRNKGRTFDNNFFKNIFSKTDDNFLRKNKLSGSTANCLWMDHKTNRFWVINTGDSRTILCTQYNKIIQLSIDHKPNDMYEKYRILSRGGFVEDDRVNGILAMSRSFGDKRLKRWLTVIPDIVSGSFTNVKFIVLASDGLYDVMTNAEIVKFIDKQLHKKIPYKKISKNLVKYSIIKKFSYDNVSAIIIFSKRFH